MPGKLAARPVLVDFGVVVAVCILQAGNHLRAILNFQIGLEDLDMHLLAFYRASARGTGIVEGQIAIMGFQEL